MYYRLTRGIFFYILPDKSINRVKSGNLQMQVNSEISLQTLKQGALWLSSRVLDSRPRDRGFEPHGLHCVVVLE